MAVVNDSRSDPRSCLNDSIETNGRSLSNEKVCHIVPHLTPLGVCFAPGILTPLALTRAASQRSVWLSILQMLPTRHRAARPSRSRRNPAPGPSAAQTGSLGSLPPDPWEVGSEQLGGREKRGSVARYSICHVLATTQLNHHRTIQVTYHVHIYIYILFGSAGSGGSPLYSSTDL